MTEDINYGPLRFLIGRWESVGLVGENRAPDPERKVENTNFRQVMTFIPQGEVENHEQLLYVLKYETRAWEEEDPEDEPFHQEVGYFIWDKANRQVMKTFVIPRGVATNAGGEADINATEFTVKAERGSTVYGISANPFLDEEFQTLSYEAKFEFLDEDEFRYDENSRLKIKGQDQIFDHTEKNTLKKVKS